MGYPLKYNVIRTEKLKFPEKGGKYGENARGSRPHHGWDLKANSGTPVFSVGTGEVTNVQEKVPGYGSVIQIKFLNGSKFYWALYAHLSRSTVEQGDTVYDGEMIGFTGNTGNARNQPPHLHFEISTSSSLKKGRNKRIDPAEVLGKFLKENDAGRSIVIEESRPSDINIKNLENALKQQNIA